jgi:Glycosyltransferase family 87
MSTFAVTSNEIAEPLPEHREWLRRTLFHAAVLTGLVFAAYLVLVAAPFKGSMAFDVVSYWRLDLAAPYHGRVGDLGFFPYSPAIALLFAPFAALPWIVFVSGWYAILFGALVFLGRRDTLVLLAIPFVAIDLYHGNLHLLLGAAIVLGFRYPAAWGFVVLTKVTPGIGLLWFAVRREWRSLAIALGATAAVAALTFVLLPSQWIAWINVLIDNAGTPPPWPALPIPLWVRLPAAAAIIVWGARRDARWVVPVAAAMSVPALWPGAFAIVAASWALRRIPAEQDRGYHAPNAGQPRRESERASA